MEEEKSLRREAKDARATELQEERRLRQEVEAAQAV